MDSFLSSLGWASARDDRGYRSWRPRIERRQWHRNVLVNRLPLVVVFGMQLAIGPGDGLRRLIGFEAQIALLVLFRELFVAQTIVGKHQIVVRLQVFGIDC